MNQELYWRYIKTIYQNNNKEQIFIEKKEFIFKNIIIVKIIRRIVKIKYFINNNELLNNKK
jgi:hypothetical protein